MIARTDAVVLRISPFSRTSHVVTWLSEDTGKLVTLVKGACRPKSAFLGQYDLFYTCELLYYERSRSGLHIARECSPLRTRSLLRSNWRACAVASYACDLVCRIAVPGDCSHALYDLTTNVLDALPDASRRLHLLLWFEFTLLRAIGIGPRVSSCASCAAPLRPQTGLKFSPSSGGVLCRRCVSSAADACSIGPDHLAILQHWERLQQPAGLRSLQYSPQQLVALQRHLGVFLMFHADVSQESRQIATKLATS